MFGEKLRQLRKENGYSMDRLIELYNSRFGGKMNKSTISRYENSLQEPMFTVVKNFAELFGVTVDELINDDAEKTGADFPSNVTPLTDIPFVKIPIIGRVAAGTSCFAESNIIGYDYVPSGDIGNSENYVFLRVRGDSMYPEIKEDDLVLVRCQSSVDSGSIAVVVVDDEDGVVKKVVYGDNWIELVSINPMYPVRRFEGEDVLRIRVLGLVKQILRKL